MNNFKDWLPIKSCAAWIDPDNNVHLVDFFDHMKFFKNYPVMGEFYDAYQSQLDYNQQMIDDDLASLDPNEHPAMHRFYGINDEARDILYLEAYNRGWVRLGVQDSSFNRRLGRKTYYEFKIEFYGDKDRIEVLEKDIRKLSRDINARTTLFLVVKSKSRYAVFDYEFKNIS